MLCNFSKLHLVFVVLAWWWVKLFFQWRQQWLS